MSLEKLEALLKSTCNEDHNILGCIWAPLSLGKSYIVATTCALFHACLLQSTRYTSIHIGVHTVDEGHPA